MLYRPKVLRLLPAYRRAIRDGERARAVVLAARPWWGTSGAAVINCRLRLKVHLAGGSTTTVDRVERYRDLGDRSVVGSILPMRIAGGTIEVDLPELRRSYQARIDKLERQAIRDAEKRLRG